MEVISQRDLMLVPYVFFLLVPVVASLRFSVYVFSLRLPYVLRLRFCLRVHGDQFTFCVVWKFWFRPKFSWSIFFVVDLFVCSAE